MKTYKVVADVDQIVTKTIELFIKADSEEDALGSATEALGEFPKPVTNQNVKRMMSLKTNFWVPRSVDFKSVEETEIDY